MVEHHFPNVVVSDCLTYSLPSVAAGCWIGIDDLEFRSEDDLGHLGKPGCEKKHIGNVPYAVVNGGFLGRFFV